MADRTPQERFTEALDECNWANEELLAGRGAPIKNAFSHSSDATLFGGFGGHEVGWEQIGPRLDWVARSFAGGSCTYEVLASTVGKDLAVVVQFERGEARLTDREAPLRIDFRVTMAFRLEGDAWKLLHRHADHMIEQQKPV
jgi:SnoaL-like domain